MKGSGAAVAEGLRRAVTLGDGATYGGFGMAMIDHQTYAVLGV